MGKPLLRFIQPLGLPLKRILLTHGHSDHVGALEHLRRHHAVPVLAHREEIPYAEGIQPYPRRKKAAASVARGLLQPLEQDGAGHFQPVGGLVPYFTPGHSPGHVVYYHPEDGVLLAGDLFTSRRGKLKPPIAMFTADMGQAVESGAIVRRLRPKLVSVCHGGEIKNAAEQYEEYRRRYGRQ
jgi:glyoxylase-like metal-dependent hydrolase (beta-lactamase superfamily II)